MSDNTSLFSATSTKDGIEIHEIDNNIRWITTTHSLNSSVYGKEFRKAFTIGEGLLVVGSANHTHIFAQDIDSKEWKEALRLDQSYQSYKLSDRTLIAVNEKEVYSMDIRDCTPGMTTPHLTFDNSTHCYKMNVSVSFSYFDEHNGGMSAEHESGEECSMFWGESWQLRVMTSEFVDGDATVIKSLAPREDAECGYTSTICLNEGWYKTVFWISN